MSRKSELKEVLLYEGFFRRYNNSFITRDGKISALIFRLGREWIVRLWKGQEPGQTFADPEELRSHLRSLEYIDGRKDESISM